MSFFNELKRRNVYRVAALYLVVSWLILQVTDVLTSIVPVPEWTGRLVLLLLAIGFPIALVLAWAFELTPGGVQREREEEEAATAPAGQRKTIDYVILAALVTALAWFAWQHDWSDQAGAPDRRGYKSLVVLPLDNLTNDPDQAYFVAGMHEALITRLSRIESLRVISRTSAMRFDDLGMSVPEIAKELGVEAVVEGSVLKAGDTVRITVQLIEAGSDRNLWAENFDRRLENILALYGEVTGEIAKQVRAKLTDNQQTEFTAPATVDPEVYAIYLKGRYLCDNWSPAEMERGVRLLEEVVRRNPGNASAHAQLAICLQYSAFFGYVRPTDILDASREAAEMAVQLDNSLAEGHVALAGVQYYLEFDARAALASLDRALELNPQSSRALLHASWLLGESGRFREAFDRSRRALSVDPFSVLVNHALGQLHYLNRNYEEAIAQTRNALDLDPDDPSLHYFLALPYQQTGRFDEAIDLYLSAVRLSGGAPLYQAGLGYAYGRAGRTGEALTILAELESDGAAAPYQFAMLNLGLGQHEEAIGWLEKAHEARDSHLIYINRDPRFDPLRQLPRFIQLLERLDFPPPDEPLTIAGQTLQREEQ